MQASACVILIAAGCGGTGGKTGQGGQGGGMSCGAVPRPSSNLTPDTCTFSVPEPPTSDGTTTRGNISVNATDTGAGTVATVPMNATNGWTYGDATMTSIVLHGTACVLWTDGTYSTITIVFQCLLV
jgi:hypothetical protein